MGEEETLKRTPLRPKRPTLRRGEPTSAEKAQARLECYQTAQGLCHWCRRFVPLSVGHLCHARAKRRFGWMPSEQQAHWWGCGECHGKSHNAGGKPCPPKHQAPTD